MSSKATTPVADPEPDGRRPTLGDPVGPLLRCEGSTASDVARRLPGCLLRLPVGVELIGGAVAGIGAVGGQQPLRGDRVGRQPEHLAVRRVRPARGLAGDLGAFVPVQAEPVQPIEDVLLVGQ